MRTILHIDMDAFFASVEEKRRPELIGKPVVIGGSGDPTKRGVVSTASYEARKYGIHSAMPLRTALKLCQHAVFLPVDMEEYARVSEVIKEIFRSFSPLLEDVGIDEAFLEIPDTGTAPEKVAVGIKEKVLAETGLTCSIGIAPNKLLAKIASDIQKPDGLTVIREEDIHGKIWGLPARKLWGVGPKTEVHLKEMGILTIGDIAALSLEQLIETFGDSYGRYLYDASRGIDESPIVTHWEPKSVSRETTFDEDISRWQEIARTLAALTKEVVTDMKERGYRGRTVTVKIRFSDFKTYTRATTLEKPSDVVEEIRRAAFHCLGKIEIKRKVRLIGVRLSGLEKVS